MLRGAERNPHTALFSQLTAQLLYRILTGVVRLARSRPTPTRRGIPDIWVYLLLVLPSSQTPPPLSLHSLPIPSTPHPNKTTQTQTCAHVHTHTHSPLSFLILGLMSSSPPPPPPPPHKSGGTSGSEPIQRKTATRSNTIRFAERYYTSQPEFWFITTGEVKGRYFHNLSWILILYTRANKIADL